MGGLWVRNSKVQYWSMNSALRRVGARALGMSWGERSLQEVGKQHWNDIGRFSVLMVLGRG